MASTPGMAAQRSSTRRSALAWPSGANAMAPASGAQTSTIAAMLITGDHAPLALKDGLKPLFPIRFFVSAPIRKKFQKSFEILTAVNPNQFLTWHKSVRARQNIAAARSLLRGGRIPKEQR